MNKTKVYNNVHINHWHHVLTLLLMFVCHVSKHDDHPRGGNTTFPRASRKAPFFRKSKEKLWETQDYKKYIVINMVYWNYITIVNKNIFNQSWSCMIWYMKKKDYLLDEWFDFIGLRIAHDLIMLLEKNHCVWFDYAVR